MLDKETVLRKRTDSESGSKDYFIKCLKRAREITESNEELNESIERFLYKFVEKEEE
ncbi:MAG: hypothetical protein ACLFSM_00515 [Thermoplasmata archaeon]